jgi:hypothetical protein
MTEGRTFKLPQVKTGKNQPFIVATMPSSFTSLTWTEHASLTKHGTHYSP